MLYYKKKYEELEQWLLSNNIIPITSSLSLTEIYGFQYLNQFFNEYVAVELGAAYGASAITIGKGIKDSISNNKPYRIITCDNGQEMNLDLLEQNILLANKTFDLNIELYKGSSLDLLSSLPDNYICFCYIDSWHWYDHVVKELSFMPNKIHDGGLVCGDDYAPNESGVVQAVDEFLINNRENFPHSGFFLTTWWAIKKGMRI